MTEQSLTISGSSSVETTIQRRLPDLRIVHRLKSNTTAFQQLCQEIRIVDGIEVHLEFNWVDVPTITLDE